MIFFICYIVFIISLIVFSFLFVNPFIPDLQVFNSFSASISPQYKTFIFFVLLSVFFYFFYAFTKRFQNLSYTKKEFYYIIGLSLLLIFSYPAMVSYDIFNYIATAKVVYFYHENPYVVMPIEIREEEMLLFMQAANKTALYGVVWILLTAIPFIFSFGNFLLSLITFRLFVALFYFATIFLLYKYKQSLYNISLFALNPLVLFETFLSGHNDIVMMFFALASFYLLKKRYHTLAIVSFFLSIGIKYAAIFLIPIFILILFQKLKDEKLIFLYSFISMFIIFLLASLREEIYPWYAIWFLVFVPFLSKSNPIRFLSLVLSFGLLLRYIPYMYSGTYFGYTPHIKIALTIIPVLFAVVYIVYTKRFRKI